MNSQAIINISAVPLSLQLIEALQHLLALYFFFFSSLFRFTTLVICQCCVHSLLLFSQVATKINECRLKKRIHPTC